MPRKIVDVEQEILEPRRYTWVPLVVVAVTCGTVVIGSVMGYATLQANVTHLKATVVKNEADTKERIFETLSKIKETKETVKSIQGVQFQDGRDLSSLKATVDSMAASIDKLVTALNKEREKHGRYYRGPGPGTRRAP